MQQAFPKLHELEQRYGSLIRGQILGARKRKKEGRFSKQRAPMFSFRQGLGTLPERYQELLGDSILLRTRALRIRKDSGRWIIDAEQEGRHIKFCADHVIYAGTAHQLPEISIEEVPTSELETFRSIYHPCLLYTSPSPRDS